MVGRQRSAARWVKNGFSRLRSRRWSSPSMCRMLRSISSRNGPLSMPNSSAIFWPGNVADRFRRKNSPASRSRVRYPSGVRVSQVCSASAVIVVTKTSPDSSGSLGSTAGRSRSAASKVTRADRNPDPAVEERQPADHSRNGQADAMTLTVLVRDDPDSYVVSGPAAEILASAGDLRVLSYSDPDQLPDGFEEVEALIVSSGRADEQLAVAARLPKLRLVQTLSAGVEQWEGRLPDGVLLSNARGAHGGATAEWAITALLAVYREIPGFVTSQQAARWEPHTPDTLAGKSVLVLGAGDLATEFRRRAEPFDATVEVVGRSARDGVHGIDALDDLLPAADAVIVMLPVTEATRGVVGRERLALMPDGAVLVNAGRGPLVDTDGLVAELTAGRLRAALDVTDPEPLPQGHPLWTARGLLLTPHVAGSTRGFEQRAWRVAADQLAQFAAGREPDNLQR